MPKLNKQAAKEVAKQEGGSFEAIPPGTYLATLLKCEVKEGPAGPYWKWEYRVDKPEEFANRRLFNNTSLAQNALWKLNETFKAFGVATDTDTDELCGEQVRLIVSQQTIQSGNRKGETGNQVDRVLPLKKGSGGAAAASNGKPAPSDEDDDEDEGKEKVGAGAAAASSDGDDEDPF